MPLTEPVRQPRIAVVGGGLVGTRTAGDLTRRGAQVFVVGGSRISESAPQSGRRLRGARRHDYSRAPEEVDLVVLATESMHQVEAAEYWIRRGVGVVATADRPSAVRALWNLRDLARRNNVSVSLGVACAPGLSSLLVERLSAGFASIDSITTARFGTGGPSCAREHHRSMAARSLEVRAGASRWARGGSGRMLVWFPEPIGPQDCYRAGLSEPFLLHRRFNGVSRIQSLQAATRRDRLTARLPMLRPPHAEGLIGGVWVEVRGRTSAGMVEHRVLAATAPQTTAAAAVAAAVSWHQVSINIGSSDLWSDSDREVDDGRATDPLWWCDLAEPILAEIGTMVQFWGPDGDRLDRPGPTVPVQAARKRTLHRNLGRSGRQNVKS